MSAFEKFVENIPFLKKRPALSAGLVLLAAVLIFSILNLEALQNFTMWAKGKDVTIIVRDSAVTPSELFTTGYTHTISFQILNSRTQPLIVQKVHIINWNTKEPIAGYKYIPINNEPVKPGETHIFKTTNHFLDTRPGLGKNDAITQGLKIYTNFSTYTVPIQSYQHSF